jgi:hypothetical protein
LFLTVRPVVVGGVSVGGHERSWGRSAASGRTHLVRIVVAVARGYTQGEVLRVLLNDVGGALDQRLQEDLPA